MDTHRPQPHSILNLRIQHLCNFPALAAGANLHRACGSGENDSTSFFPGETEPAVGSDRQILRTVSRNNANIEPLKLLPSVSPELRIRGGSVCLNRLIGLLSGLSTGFRPLREAVD